MSGQSAWWAVPARPDRWFSEAELAAAPSGRRVVAREVVAMALAAVGLVAVASLGVWRVVPEALAVVVAAALAAASLRPARSEELPARPCEPRVVAEVAAIADRLGVGAPRLRCVADTRPVASLHGAAVIELSDALVDADPAVRRWVVAHELAHLRRLDPLRRAGGIVARGLVAVAAIEAIAASSTVGRPAWALVGVIAAKALLAWRRRVAERRADAVAGEVEPVDAEALRPVVASTGTVLDPGLLARLLHGHPAPAERLERASRNRQRSTVVHLPFN